MALGWSRSAKRGRLKMCSHRSQRPPWDSLNCSVSCSVLVMCIVWLKCVIEVKSNWEFLPLRKSPQTTTKKKKAGCSQLFRLQFSGSITQSFIQYVWYVSGKSTVLAFKFTGHIVIAILNSDCICFFISGTFSLPWQLEELLFAAPQ